MSAPKADAEDLPTFEVVPRDTNVAKQTSNPIQVVGNFLTISESSGALFTPQRIERSQFRTVKA